MMGRKTIMNGYEARVSTSSLATDHLNWDAAERNSQGPAPMAYAGAALIVWLCFLRPFEWISVIYAFPVGNLLGVISLFVIGSYVLGGQRSPLTPELKLLFLWAAQMCVATAFAHWRGGAFDKLRHDVVIIVLMAVALGFAITSIERLKSIVRIQAFSVLVITLLALIAGTHDSEGRLVGVGGTFSNSNDLASLLAVTAPFCLMFLFIARSIVFKIFWGGAAAAMVYVINGTLSRSGLIALVVGVLICLWNFAFKERRRGARLLLAVVFCSMLVVASSPKFRERLSVISGNASDARGVAASANDSSHERQQLLWRAIQVMLHHPLLGVGPGNFYPFSGAQYGDWHVSHNTYTQCGAEAGIPALLIFTWMLRSALKHCKSVQKQATATSEASALAVALKSSLLAYAVAAFFADTAYQFLPYFLMVLAGVLWRIENASMPVESKISRNSVTLSGGESAPLDASLWQSKWASE